MRWGREGRIGKEQKRIGKEGTEEDWEDEMVEEGIGIEDIWEGRGSEEEEEEQEKSIIYNIIIYNIIIYNSIIYV